ncbi:MAG: hypothetical protein AAF543_05150 [Pseudomonadota bacterium]
MNTAARKILNEARKAVRDDPQAYWPAVAIELAEMFQDREKQLVTLHERLGVRVTTSPAGPLLTG